MSKLLNIITPLHKSTCRDYIVRMTDSKVDCMKKARKYELDYWDGNRRYGYGGYKYDGRWSSVADSLISYYKLPENARILDVGCGKGFLLYEFKKILPNCKITGFDISYHALKNAKAEIKENLFHYNAKDKYPFQDNEFDLVLSITTIFNLYINELKTSLNEIERVGKNKYITLESYRNEKELFNLQCWALTCECFFTPSEWKWLFQEFNYTGDFEFIYFE